MLFYSPPASQLSTINLPICFNFISHSISSQDTEEYHKKGEGKWLVEPVPVSVWKKIQAKRKFEPLER